MKTNKVTIIAPLDCNSSFSHHGFTQNFVAEYATLKGAEC